MSAAEGRSAVEVLANHRDTWGTCLGDDTADEALDALRAACGDPAGWVVVGPDGRLYEMVDERPARMGKTLMEAGWLKATLAPVEPSR